VSERKKEVTTNFNLLRSRLESEQKHLIEQLEQLEANVRPAEERREGSPFGKREEEAAEVAELEKRLVAEKRIRGLLTEVEHALHKFEEGTYGLCDICGKPIDPARLEALPQASLCLSCKALQAKNAKNKSSAG
jgi:DnaK suppressor protein